MSLPIQYSPDVNPTVGGPDYSYLEGAEPVAPQITDHDAYVYDAAPGVNVIPLLDESDGLHIGIDGKLHLVSGSPVSDAELHAETGAFTAREVHHPETVAAPLAVAPSTFAIHGLASAALYRSAFSAGGAGHQPRHRR